MNLFGKRESSESKEKKRQLINLLIEDKVELNPALTFYDLTLKPSIMDSYIEPTLIISALFFLILGLSGIVLGLIFSIF